MKFLRKFKSMFNPVVQLIILTIILVLVALNELSFTFGLKEIIEWIALVLMFIGVIFLVIRKSFFASYVVVFILYFSTAFTDFFNEFISVSFNPFEIVASNDLMLYVNLVIFIYLALMIASYILSGSLKSRAVKGKVATLTFLFFAFLWLFLGFNAALVVMPIVGIAFVFGNNKATILMMISYLITYSYVSLNSLFDVFTVNTLIIALLEVILLAYAIMLAIPMFFGKKSKK